MWESVLASCLLVRHPAFSKALGAHLTDPLGKFLAKVLPSRRFSLLGREFSLNPGPFNRKEHMLITM